MLKLRENRGSLCHSDGIMMLGSCFSDNIGARLRAAMMKVDINPFGTVFNPMSVASSIHRIISGTPVAGTELFQANGQWNSYAFHSRFSSANKLTALRKMNDRLDRAHVNLAQAKALIITLGTAMVYRLKTTGEVVSNCHKVPQHEFERGMADIDEIAATLSVALAALRRFNPGIKVIFTISPIRHIADGLETNSLSKAVLRCAVDKVIANSEGCEYFPAYEIVLDDLRDYRFYNADMVHPTDVAIEYIWQQFQATYFDDRTAQAVARCERVSKRLQHRPMSDNREAIERFRADTATVVRNLIREYPYLEDSLRELADPNPNPN